jgi:hypothetical protein
MTESLCRWIAYRVPCRWSSSWLRQETERIDYLTAVMDAELSELRAMIRAREILSTR